MGRMAMSNRIKDQLKNTQLVLAFLGEKKARQGLK